MIAELKVRTVAFCGVAMHYCTGALPDGSMFTATSAQSKDDAREAFATQARRVPAPIKKGKKP